MFTRQQDSQNSVSNIHKRWSLTRINPSSYKASYGISIAAAAVTIIFSHFFYTSLGTGIYIYLPAGLAALTGAQFLDYIMLRGTPANKLAKVFHVSAFANMLWAVTVVLGVVADLLFARNSHDHPSPIVEGLMLAAGLRIGIFVSVFGAKMGRAVAISFVQPLVFFAAFVSVQYYIILTNTEGLVFGSSLVALGVAWTFIADRAGRPEVKSTFGLLQAFLAAWTENEASKMEEIAESRARTEQVSTYISRFSAMAGNKPESRGTGTDISVILPDIHPGPFNPIGGSNLPYALFAAYSRNAIIMHSVSDHSLNIPSKKELAKYVDGLTKASVVASSETCTLPVQVKIGKSTATGIAFGNSAIVMLSLAPFGMEDIPGDLRVDLERYSTELGFYHVLIVDCHNAMGSELGRQDASDLLLSARQCLEALKTAEQHKFGLGFATLDGIPVTNSSESASGRTALMPELGQAGLAVMVIDLEGKKYAIGWADSNNMENHTRDSIITEVNGRTAGQVQMLEVCTSDTHSTSGKRTKDGYYAFGTQTGIDRIAPLFVTICQAAAEKCRPSRFELLKSKSTIKVMGSKQFDDYSHALDRSMRITKIFLAATFAVYVAMLVI